MNTLSFFHVHDMMSLWMIVGVVLGMVEMALFTTVLLWFAASAVILALLLYYGVSISVPLQVFIFASLSAILALIAHNYIKHKKVNSVNDFLNSSVTGVIRGRAESGDSIIEFDIPFMGDRRWNCVKVDFEPLHVGDKCKPVGMSGNIVVVERIN